MKIAIAFLMAFAPLATGLAQEGEKSKSDEMEGHAQHGAAEPAEASELPEGWVVRLDKPDPSVSIGSGDNVDVFFVDMPPGWHITSHQRAIFYRPETKAEGTFSAKAAIHLFDPGERDREGFGIFVGGKNLDGDAQEYTYFLLRNTGDFLIKRRTGSETSVLVDWTPSDAIMVHPHDSTVSVLNELSVNAGSGDTVSFMVNGTEVANLPKSDAKVDGVVGLRVNHGLNLHVAELTVGM